MQRVLITVVLALLAPSCFLSRETVNVPLGELRFDELVPGQTTATETVERFGAPNEVVQLARRSAYLYRYDQSKVSGLVLVLVNFINTDLRQDRVWLFFDENDVLTHYGTTFEADDARYAMPWFKIHDED